MSKVNSLWKAGTLMVALALAALPGRSQEVQSDWSSAQTQAAVARVKAALARIEVAAQLQEGMPGAGQGMSVWTMDDDERGWLGVSIQEVAPEKAKELKLSADHGALITEVEVDSPAAKAGLKANDVVTEYNGQRVEGTAQFRRLVRETPAGRTVRLTIWRDGRSQNISVTLASYQGELRGMMRNFAPRNFDFRFEMPEFGNNLLGRPQLGIGVENLSGQLGQYFGAPEGEGVLVTEVRSGSAAEKAGVKAGDVIIKVNGERVRTANELRQKIREKRDTKTVSLGVLRKGAEMSLNVEVEQPKPVERKKLVSFRRAFI